MVSDDERREVAERLRELNGNVSHVRRVYEDEGFSILCDDQADYYQICHAVAGYLPAEHMHPCDYEELHARLADLIEPSDHIGDSDKMVDRDALLELADALGDGFGMTGSPSAAQLKVLADINVELREYARRIREACNVVDAG